MEPKKLTLVQHLTELRVRLLFSLASLAGAILVSLFFCKEIYFFLQKPILPFLPSESTFLATSPFEAIRTYLKVAALSGIFFASPFIFYHLWRFIAPGLQQREKRLALVFVFLSTLFFTGGGLFGYFVIFPVGFRFLISTFEGSGTLFLPQMGDYLGFISRMLLIFGAVFELPLMIFLLGRLGIVQIEMLTRARRYVIVFMFLVAGVLTPGPDVLSQLLLALPLLVLYEISILALRFTRKNSRI